MEPLDPVIATVVILLLAVVAFASGKVPLAVVAGGVMVALWATGVLELGQVLAGFAEPTVLLIACLFIVSEALDATGVTAWVGQLVISRAGTARRPLTLVIALIVAVLTAFISINGAVAALVPVVVVVASRAGIVPSKLLLPVAFAASAGSLLTLTGTPVNLLVSELAVAAGGRPFGFFEFALVGLPLVVCTAAIVALGGGRLLPVRQPDRLGVPRDARATAKTLRESYQLELERPLIGVREGVVEVMIAPRSTLIGREIIAGMRTRDEDLVILAIRHANPDGTEESRPNADGTTTLRAGDAVLVQGPWDALERYARSADVIAVTPPQELRRAVPLGAGAKRSLGVLAALVLLLATAIVPPVIAGLLAVMALIVARVLSPAQAFRAVSWTTIVLIAGMVPLSTAFVTTGAAGGVADAVLGFIGSGSPHLALLVLGVITLVLGQFISNVATVLVVAPISIALAQSMQVSVQPFMMALTVVGAASFLTPLATPANLMVMQPAGYRFGDYWRLGLPLALLFLAVSVLYVPLIWPFEP
ncbi:SLC13 family permease [Protaetiibacter intestinalis]|uniref:SLC13/DASS family transporter n=1 Tax=Protaetiibacter intestinalis TaxID=2419774 RepID=A0A387B899_9MICO|nr:SLC13 family permease [Protaetiibacter intestinalis]AYF98051.1 SLC13/DASS family transporter [Protaetiibacter intestinalis]